MSGFASVMWLCRMPKSVKMESKTDKNNRSNPANNSLLRGKNASFIFKQCNPFFI